MKLNLYEQTAKDCNLTGKLFHILKVNILVQLKAVAGLDGDLTSYPVKYYFVLLYVTKFAGSMWKRICISRQCTAYLSIMDKFG